MKTSSNTPPRHITTVMYNIMERLFNSVTEKLKVVPFVSAFHTLKFL